MKILVESTAPDSPAVSPQVQRHVQGVLYRLRNVVSQVHVRLEDSKPHPRHPLQRCRVQVELQGGGTAQVEVLSRTWRQALEAALLRLKQRVVVRLRQRAALRLA